MEANWIVEEVTEKPGIVLATLRPVQWFKKNPDYEASDDAEEFIDAAPIEEGAEFIEGDGPKITIDITQGPELHPMDAVTLDLNVNHYLGAST